jgi:hypothetical protein
MRRKEGAMSDTPRTDALPRIRQAGATEYVPIEDCRQLERELAEAKKENKKLITDMILHEQMSSQFQDERDTLAEALETVLDEVRNDYMACKDEVKAALASVKGGSDE